MKKNVEIPIRYQMPQWEYGFRCGMIWEKIQRGETFRDYPIDSCMRSQIERLFEGSNYAYKILPEVEDGEISTLTAGVVIGK